MPRHRARLPTALLPKRKHRRKAAREDVRQQGRERRAVNGIVAVALVEDGVKREAVRLDLLGQVDLHLGLQTDERRVALLRAHDVEVVLELLHLADLVLLRVLELVSFLLQLLEIKHVHVLLVLNPSVVGLLLLDLPLQASIRLL